jgi:hypothetical protein
MIAPAKTGKEKNNKINIINTNQTNKGTFSASIMPKRILKFAVIKLTPPKINEIPTKCNEF